MSQTVILHLPDETADRYRRGAIAARKPLEEFLLERLTESVLPQVEQPASPLDEELRQLEELDDEALQAITRATLPLSQQRRYNRLLGKNAMSALDGREQETLRALGEEARRLTLMKTHALLVLKWRGHALPRPEDLLLAE